MDKLTQFVSKSFESNNNTDQCLNLTSVKTVESVIKCEQRSPVGEEQKAKPVAKNWLISDTTPVTSSTPPPLGIDLRLNNNSNVIYSSSLVNNEDRETSKTAENLKQSTGCNAKNKWLFENNIEVSKNSYSSSSSSPPIDLEDSKSCSETLTSETADKEPRRAINKVNNETDKKICKSQILHDFLHVCILNT